MLISGMQGKKHYSEKLFTSVRLSERVPEHNLYRRLRDTLDLDFVYDLTREFYGTTGLPSIDPKVFFKFILVSHLEGINSDRKLIEHCSLRLDILYFLGYDVDEALPWHSTISRTRQLYPEDLFKEVFERVFALCVDAGLVEGTTQAIDSTISKANASKDNLYRDDQNTIPSDNPPPVGKGKVNSKRQSPTDPDARLAHRPSKGTTLGYLTNVAVDTAHHVITHIQPDFADKRDSECLQSIVKEVKQRLAAHELMPINILADTNYSNGPNYAWLEQQGLVPWIPVHGAYNTDRKEVAYNPATDSFICQAGKYITAKTTRLTRRGDTKKLYTILSKECKECPFKTTCLTGKSTYKTINASAYHTFFRRAHQRQETFTGKLMRKLRSSRVEPVIGTLVNSYGIRKFRLRGIQANAKELFIAAAAYNLKKLLTIKPPITDTLKTLAKQALKGKNCLFKHYIGAFASLLAIVSLQNINPWMLQTCSEDH